MSADRWTREIITSETELTALLGEPTAVVRGKLSSHLNPLTRAWIERSPFFCLATADDQGNCDVSPRGDPAGFVRILDDWTLLLPERPGNRLADSLRNILRNPHVGILFIVPGVHDTFRVNGRAAITTDAALLESCTVEGKRPRLGILVEIEAAYTHCSKALLRSEFWNPARFLERSALPSPGAMMRAVQGEDFDSETYDRERLERYARREGFY